MNIFLLLGANLGDREATFRQATARITERIGPVRRASSWWETAAWGVTDQPSFLNQVLLVDTKLSPIQVLAETQQIELDAGRIRKEKWGARILDIDLLYYGSEIIDLPELKIPHPFIQERRFTLAPLAEISPDYVHPLFLLTQQQLLDQCVDNSAISKLSNA